MLLAAMKGMEATNIGLNTSVHLNPLERMARERRIALRMLLAALAIAAGAAVLASGLDTRPPSSTPLTAGVTIPLSQ